MRAGVIIAGGRSTRFGDADKAVAELAGTPLIRRVADRLDHVVDEIIVNCRDEQIDAIDAALADLPLDGRFAPDPVPDRGPLAGIGAGLRATDADYAAVVACDMPFVAPALITHLFDRADGHDAAVPRLDNGWYQTTQAVYRADSMADACDRAIDRDGGRIVDAFDELDVVEVDETEVMRYADLETFANLNTQEEFQSAAARLTTE